MHPQMLARGRMSPDCLEACGIMRHHVASCGIMWPWPGRLESLWGTRGIHQGFPKIQWLKSDFRAHLVTFNGLSMFESFVFYRFSISIISIAVLSPWVSSPISIRHRLCALPRVLHALWRHWSPWSTSGSGMSLPWCHASRSLCALVDPLTTRW